MAKKMHTKTSAAILGGLVVVAGLAYVLAKTPAALPKEFVESRIQAVGAVNNLAQLMNNSLSNLEKVNTYVQNKNDIEARALIKFEFEQRAERQNAAVLLASHLETMARAAEQIDSSGARGDAVEAITSGIAMVSRMVSYSTNLELLFTALDQKSSGGNPPAADLTKLATDLNSDAAAINQLSVNFNEALDSLDRRYGVE